MTKCPDDAIPQKNIFTAFENCENRIVQRIYGLICHVITDLPANTAAIARNANDLRQYGFVARNKVLNRIRCFVFFAHAVWWRCDRESNRAVRHGTQKLQAVTIKDNRGGAMLPCTYRGINRVVDFDCHLSQSIQKVDPKIQRNRVYALDPLPRFNKDSCAGRGSQDFTRNQVFHVLREFSWVVLAAKRLRKAGRGSQIFLLR